MNAGFQGATQLGWLQPWQVRCPCYSPSILAALLSCIMCSLMSVCGARCRLCWQCFPSHISSLVGSQSSGELLIIAREPAKQRRAAGGVGIGQESAY